MRKSLRAVRSAPASILIFLITSAPLALLTGCGGSSASPVAPTGIPAATVRVQDGFAATPTGASGPAPVLETGADVTLNGSLADLEGSCPALSMTIAGTAVTANAATVFSEKACPAFHNGDTVYVVGSTRADGGVVASRIYYVAPTREALPPPVPMGVEVTLSGEISGFTGVCPAVSLTVSGTLVKAGTATMFAGTTGCTDLRNGDLVSVGGTRQTDGSVVAARITHLGPPAVSDTTLNGSVTGLSGTCPALTLSVAGTPLKTEASTAFNNRVCAELRNGDTVYAIGPKTDGTVVASRIYYVAPAPPVEVTVSGAISNYTGTCPAVSMTVNGTVAKASSSTTFSGAKGCSMLQNGDAVTAAGTRQSDGSLLVTRVTYTGPAPVAETILNGTVASLAGTCPALSMSVTGTPVRTTSATVFNNRTCAELRNGDTIYALGPKIDGTVVASRIYLVPAPPTTAPPTTAPPTPAPPSVTGTISVLAGTCPALSMKLTNGTYVRTTSATRFTGRACSDVRTGVAVQVTGPRQTDGVIVAETFFVPVVR